MSPRKAGRALDAEVAERVMGWTDVRMGVRMGPHEWRGNREIAKPLDTPKGKPSAAKRHGGWCVVPNYSTDLAAAWTVVEKMAERRCSVSLHSWPIDAGDWHAQFTSDDLAGVKRASSAPLAICLAALAALDASGPAEGR